MKPHPRLKLRAAVSKTDYKLRGLSAPDTHCTVELDALVDMGAMMVVLGEKEMGMLGIRRNELIPTTVTIQVANGGVVRALRMILLVISCKDEAGVTHKTTDICDGWGKAVLPLLQGT